MTTVSPLSIIPREDKSSDMNDDSTGLDCLENMLFRMNLIGFKYSTLNDLLIS